MARRAGRPAELDLLERVRKTRNLDGATADERFERLSGAIALREKHAELVAGRAVLLVDDVMTSGATFSACSEACLAAGARRVDVVALARVAKEP